jgi:hypothetical protein
MCRAHKSSISAQNELAAGNLFQKVPVKRRPVYVQNIIQPTPNKSATFFQLYDPSVTHTSVFDFMPSINQVSSCFLGWLSLTPSHIYFPPHVSKTSQKSVGKLGSLASSSPLLSLLTLLFVKLMTDVGISGLN